jgi:hypothetical protein
METYSDLLPIEQEVAVSLFVFDGSSEIPYVPQLLFCKPVREMMFHCVRG